MGPLNGYRVIELAGIGPGPFCGMMLSDMGADVIRVDRINKGAPPPKDVLQRNRQSIAVDLKSPEGVEVVLKLVEKADAFYEGFRPGVTERLGLGPKEVMGRNEKIVYGRMTGWGQDGPMSQAAGHDINYIGLSGALHAIGEPGSKPVPPLNLIGDFGGGGMLLAYGLVCGMLETQKSGKGQVIDAAMVDGAASLMAMFFSMGRGFQDERGSNLLDGGSHFYNTYETSDSEHICVGSIEPQFYQLLVEKAGLDPNKYGPQMDKDQWVNFKEELTDVFKTKTRYEWCEIMEGTDGCFAPVLSIFEAPQHPHNSHRKTFVEVDGVTQPAPSPRFSRTAASIRNPARSPGQDTGSILSDYGYSSDEIDSLKTLGIVS